MFIIFVILNEYSCLHVRYMYSQSRILSMDYSWMEHVVNLVCNTHVNILRLAESLSTNR